MYMKAITEFVSDEMAPTCSLKQFCIIDMKDEILKMVDDIYQQVYEKTKSVTSKQVLEMYGLTQIDPSIKDEATGSSQQTSLTTSASAMKFVVTENVADGGIIGRFGDRLTVYIYTDDLLNVRKADIIVSAENRSLDGSGPLARHILQNAGPKYTAEHSRLRALSIGEVLVTSAGDLPFKHVFHPVVERSRDGPLPSDYYLKNLCRLIQRILTKANNLRTMRSIALPLLGAGK